MSMVDVYDDQSPLNFKKKKSKVRMSTRGTDLSSDWGVECLY